MGYNLGKWEGEGEGKGEGKRGRGSEGCIPITKIKEYAYSDGIQDTPVKGRRLMKSRRHSMFIYSV